MLKAVLFDMDGVLVDSEVLHGKAAVLAMEQLGVTVSLSYCFRFIGSTTSHMMETIIKDFNLSYKVEELLAIYKECKHKLLEEEGYDSIPYTKELILSLKQQNILLAIASSSTLEEILYVTKTFGIYSYFDKIISGASLKNPKPAPDIYLKAAKDLGVSPSECLVIEDSTFGIMAGKAAGMPVIGFHNPNSGNQDLFKADLVIEGFEEIQLNFLNQVYKRFHNIPLTILAEKNYTIRELTKTDIPSLYRLYSEPSITTYIDALSPTLEEEIEKHSAYIKNVYHFYNYGMWGVFLPNGELIGRCGIENKTIDGIGEIQLGYVIKKEYQGMGYGMTCAKAVIKYAFDYLKLPRIIALIDQNNIPSIKIAKKLGMSFEKEVTNNDNIYFLYAIEHI